MDAKMLDDQTVKTKLQNAPELQRPYPQAVAGRRCTVFTPMPHLRTVPARPPWRT
jgi:hypothetical protein